MKVAAVAAVAALLRIALAVRLPLADDEAYYWLWSRHLAWGYPDHPPMIAALVALGTAVAGDSPLAIRAVTVLLASATPLLVYVLGRDLFDPATGLRAAVIAAILPIAALGTALAFPDAPLAFFWLLGLWAGWRALRDGGGWWIAAGAALALAVLSKLTAVFLILGLAGAFGSGPWRRALRDPGLYAGAALAAALVAPLIAWNAAHDWSTIRTALQGPPWIQPRSIPENLLLFAAGQILYHGPATLALLAAIIAATRRAGPAWRYLVWMSAPLFLVVLLSAVGARAKPHWPSPAYLSAAVALGALWPGWTGLRRRLSWAALLLTGALTAVIAAAALLPVGLDLKTAFGRWEGVAVAAARHAGVRRQMGRPVFILTDGYQAASQIAYHLRERIAVTPLRAAFNLWRPPLTLTGHDVVYVETEGRWRERLLRSCTDVVKRETLMVAPGVEAALYSCTSFRGFSP